MRLTKFVGLLAMVASCLMVNGAQAAPILPVGSGSFHADSSHVGFSTPCPTFVGTMDCDFAADAIDNGLLDTTQGCTGLSGRVGTVNATIGCEAHLSGHLSVTGANSNSNGGEDPLAYDITAGPCVGLTITNARLTIKDGAFPSHTYYGNMTVNNAGWHFDGFDFAVNSGTTYVGHVVATVTPGCTVVKVRLRTGETVKEYKFSGAFAGTYQLV